ncbi:MAG: ABZJ_00895 family protein [Pseudomonadota bacterium]
MTVNLTRFALWYFGISLGMVLIFIGIEYATGIDAQNAGTSLIPAMLAAMVEGQKHAIATRDPIPKPWKQGAILAGASVGISAVLAVPLLFITPGIVDALMSYLGFVLAGLVFVYFILWLVCRFFLTFGAKNQWKAMDQKAAKSK